MRGRNGGDSGKRPYLKPGVWKVYDDLSGFPRGSDQISKTWDGFLTMKGGGWYPRQPQDFPLLSRGVTTIPNARPLNEYSIGGCNYHVAGTDEDNYLVFQDGSLIEFVYYRGEYVCDAEDVIPEPPESGVPEFALLLDGVPLLQDGLYLMEQ